MDNILMLKTVILPGVETEKWTADNIGVPHRTGLEEPSRYCTRIGPFPNYQASRQVMW